MKSNTWNANVLGSWFFQHDLQRETGFISDESNKDNILVNVNAMKMYEKS